MNKKINKKLKFFLQINIGDEDQKSGINKVEAKHWFLIVKKLD